MVGGLGAKPRTAMFSKPVSNSRLSVYAITMADSGLCKNIYRQSVKPRACMIAGIAQVCELCPRWSRVSHKQPDRSSLLFARAGWTSCTATLARESTRVARRR